MQMAGAPFFVTAATTKQHAGVKRRAVSDAVGVEHLRSQFDELAATKKNQFFPLADVRDLLLEHVLETMATELKYTVLLVCEEVTDFRSPGSDHSIGVDDREDNDASSSIPLPSSIDTTKPATVATDSNAAEPPPFLLGVSGGAQMHCKIGEGDSIPRCDALFLRMPTSMREIENEKKAAKKAIKKKIKKFKKSHGDASKLPPDFYVLSREELPIHLPSIPFADPATAGFLSTVALPKGETRTAAELLLAIDCEMCKTTKGVELTRLTVIDANEKVLIDKFVRPQNPIVDYCTQYSGITYDIMESCTTSLADVQQEFLRAVPANAILVGHSIENDLLALRMTHARVIDTTVLYPHPRGPPFRSALRFLTSMYLKRAIQTGTDGHCSIEDAVATLQLAQLKIKHGPTFPRIEQEYNQKKVINELSLAKKSVLIVDSMRACRSLAAGTACTIPCEQNPQVVSNVVHQLTTGFPPHFTWARTRGASRAELTRYVTDIRAALPEHACLVVVASGDTTALRDLHKVRTTRSDPRSSLMWDKAQQLQLNALAARTQEAIVHAFVH